MREPCGNCPFIKDNTMYLRPARIREIHDALTHDGSFHCHKTTVTSEDGFERLVTADSILCFGAALYLENTVRGGAFANLAFRIEAMQSRLDENDLRPDDKVWESLEQWLEEGAC